jgi:hypothetical protein
MRRTTTTIWEEALSCAFFFIFMICLLISYGVFT